MSPSLPWRCGQGAHWPRWGPRAGASPPWPQSSCLYSEASLLLSPPPPFPLHLVPCGSQPVPGARAGVSAWARSAAGRAAVPSLSRLIWPQQGRRQLVTGPPGAGPTDGLRGYSPRQPPPPRAPAEIGLRPLSNAKAAQAPRRQDPTSLRWDPDAAWVTPQPRIFSLLPLTLGARR